MLYFYAPIFSEGSGDAEVFNPGMLNDSDEVVSALPSLVAGVASPKCDKGVNLRFIMQTPEDFTAPNGWVEKTKEQVNADYPGLLP